MSHESEADRDKVADAIRARQSLENDADLDAVDVGGPGFTTR